MIIALAASVGAIGAIAGLTVVIHRAIEMEDNYQLSLAPAPTPDPAYTLPMQWGGPPPEIEHGLSVPYVPPDPGPVLPGELGITSPPSPPSPTPQNHITKTGSAVLVMPEPEGDHPASPDITALLAGCPYPLQGPYSSDEFALFSHLKSHGGKQTDIIATLYHAAKGGTEKYNKGRDRYMALLKTYIQTRQAIGA